MFGYVTVNKPELKIKEYNRYKAYYCGLCKTLKKQYGFLGQVTLTYDCTFLIILLSSLYEVKTDHNVERCIAHPTTKHDLLINDISEYAADMNLALTYHKFVDDYVDDRSIKGFAGKVAYQRSYKRIVAKYIRQCEVMERTLANLQVCEKERCMDIDKVSGYFGELMAELFVMKKDEWEQSLRKIGFYLGKYIYILDAYDDLAEDEKNGAYNPLSCIANSKTFEEECEQMLTMMISECSKEFEKLPIIVDAELLRNILYAGVWTKYDNIRKKKQEDRKVSKL